MLDLGLLCLVVGARMVYLCQCFSDDSYSWIVGGVWRLNFEETMELPGVTVRCWRQC
jgi:hypothetical protein